MAMASSTAAPIKIACLFPTRTRIPSSSCSHAYQQLPLPSTSRRRRSSLPLRPICSTKRPSFPSPPSPSGEVYQPFRPPPAPIPQKYSTLSTAERLDVLRNRMGLWYEYAPLIPTLSHEGFTPPSIEEATGMSGVEQNRLVVAAQVRDSLVDSGLDPDVLAFFDLGGAELLYELRFLNASQRAAAAQLVAERRLDPKGAQQLARATKDFRGRRGEEGWDSFSAGSPADCLAFSFLRISREALGIEERLAVLDRAEKEAETDSARAAIEKEVARARKRAGGEDEEEDAAPSRARVPVVRLRYGEVAEASSLAVLPVVDAVAGGPAGVAGAPRCRTEGAFGVVSAEKGWGSWAVLPGWAPVVEVLGRGVVVAFPDARALPWKMNRWEKEESILVVADRERTVVDDDEGFYLVGKGDGAGLKVVRGKALKEAGVQAALAAVVIVVRPPRDDLEDLIADEDWV